MSSTTQSGTADETPADSDLAPCPLSYRDQNRNILLFGGMVGLVYLSAPVVYVGLTHATLCQKLGASNEVSNLPSSTYFWMTPLPILVAWYFCEVRRLKTVLVSASLAVAVAGGLAALALVSGLSDELKIAVLIVHGGVLGAALGAVSTYQWEMLGRCVSEQRRGTALSVAFGAGPILAVVGSLASQLILTGEVGSISVPKLEYPWNFALLFGATVPLMGLSALLALLYVVPPVDVEVRRQPFVQGVFGGFGKYISYPLLVMASVALILISAGYNIMPNLTLYTEIATGQTAENFVGYQNTLRFGFKIFAGFLLGFVLSKSHPKSGLLITGGFLVAGVLWARFVPGTWFLISFGLMGAGELFGVYYPNYILCCSAKSEMRRNMSFASMLNMPTGISAALFGKIADEVGGRDGFLRSFETSLAILLAALLLVLFALPARPKPRNSGEAVARATS